MELMSSRSLEKEKKGEENKPRHYVVFMILQYDYIHSVYLHYGDVVIVMFSVYLHHLSDKVLRIAIGNK